jgi:transcription initiation factor TFIID subunit 2
MIHLPPTPVTETAPPLPSVKVQPKVHLAPSIKVGGTGTPARSPLVPFTPTPKVKLPIVAQQPTPSPRTPILANLPSRNGTHPATGSVILPSLKRKGRPPKPDKVPTAPKAQAAGMSINDLKACRSALKKLNTSKTASLFLQPVDPVRDKAPRYEHNSIQESNVLSYLEFCSYFEIIKNPMDLGTMGAKLEAGMYKSRADFEADFNLMINNAKTYNLPGSYVHNQAITLLLFFQKR